MEHSYYREWCIPRVQTNITSNYVKQQFIKMDIGKIIKVQDYPLKNDKDWMRMVVKVYYNPKTENSETIDKHLINNKYFKFVYNYPDYWRVYANLPQKQR